MNKILSNLIFIIAVLSDCVVSCSVSNYTIHNRAWINANVLVALHNYNYVLFSLPENQTILILTKNI